MKNWAMIVAGLFIMQALSLGAAEYNYNCIGKYVDPAGGNFMTAPFDGDAETYLVWTGQQKDERCGLVINFYKPLKITMIKIITDGTVEDMAPVAEIWDDDKFSWTPFATAPEWKRTAEQGKNIFTLEDIAGRQSCAVRILQGKQRFRIYECVIGGSGENGRAELFTLPTALDKGSRLVIAPDKTRDLVSGNKRMTLWQPGGIGGKHLVVGLCNGTGRNDRVLMRLDCSRLIEKGQVKKAELSFIAEPFGDKLSRLFLLEYIPNDNPELIKTDLSQDRATEVARFVSDDMKYPQEFKLDLTGIVNTALSNGSGVCKFRFRDLKADKFGNPQKVTSGISLSGIKLIVAP